MQMIDIEQLPGGVAAPPVRVGDTPIDEATIALEMQYHPAETAGGSASGSPCVGGQAQLRQRASVPGLLSTREVSEAQEDAAIAALLEQELEVPEPGEADCQRFFETHRERFSEPVQLRVRHILLAAADDSQGRDDAYQLGEKLLEQLKQIPERFAEFAQHHSACPSKELDGDLGWLVSGQTVPELDRALQHLPEGLHERPLASRYGWHVVSIDERREGRALPFDQVIDRVRHSLREQATRRALRHYLLALESEIGVEGDCSG